MNLNRDDLRALATMAALAAAICCASFAWATDPAPQLPPGATCDDVRTRVAELGETAALLLAVSKGATRKQIREARKCLRG